MIKPIDKIIIVGGGSAGWMSAAALIKAYPNKKIFVIESPGIPTVGVGESTIGGINNFCQYLEIKDTDFMPYVDGSYKMSIKFTDFYEKDSGSFHYPFGKPFFNHSNNGLNDWMEKKALYPDTPIKDFVNTYFPSSYLFEQNKITDKKFENFDFNNDVAYHFDAAKFGSWLKQYYCLPRGVVHISDTVVNIITDDTGIKLIVLENGQELTADLYVDCTGFKSLLLGEAIGEKFIPYNDILPNNRALATRIPYKNKEKELEPFTHCTAINNGWVWNIPSWERIGTGYVYSDKYITPEEAKKEFKDYLMSDKMVIPLLLSEVNELEFKDIQMRVGIHERTFVKNVVAIGLSAGFIEPLESSGLYTVHEFLFNLIKTLERPAITQWDRDVYNSTCYNMWKSFAEFVSLHYALSIRNDTPYWQANAMRVYEPDLLDIHKSDKTGFLGLLNYKMRSGNANIKDGLAGIIWISAGMNYFLRDRTTVSLYESNNKINLKVENKTLFARQEYVKEKWKKFASAELSLYEYLKKNIHTGK